MTLHDFAVIAAADLSERPAERFEARHLVDGAWRVVIYGTQKDLAA